MNRSGKKTQRTGDTRLLKPITAEEEREADAVIAAKLAEIKATWSDADYAKRLVGYDADARCEARVVPTDFFTDTFSRESER